MMTTLVRNVATSAVAALTLVAVSAELADAAPARVAQNTNIRQGPGTTFPIIVTAPAGAVVEVIRCGVEWCNVIWGGRPGYMIGRNLARGPAPVRVVRPVPPPVVVVGPGPYYGYGPYYGPRRFYGPGFYYGPRRWRRW
jgi:uncharacterized protein YraI